MDTVLERIRSLNPRLRMDAVNDKSFRPYGRVLQGFDVSDLLLTMNSRSIPEEGNVYVASDAELESSHVFAPIQESVYGSMAIQIGYCNGKNSNLNGLEYHKCSEINIAVTDLVLLLGRVQDVQNNMFSSEQIHAFFVPKGTAVELYQTTLHFAPCKISDEGFKCIVVLTKGTNEPLESMPAKCTEEDELLFMRNKWLLAHPERRILIERGAYAGIAGENTYLQYA
ncbi:DUF4867 family protein [Paenibacillus sp. PL2-23]|uniref:DUF4867 family protein n=1 Tax=Paenibacillus sp. PL2-23 TaxID=2100729 RepID=UPI0030FC5A51